MKQMLAGLSGRFDGHNLLWLEGSRSPALESDASAEVEVLTAGRLLRCGYTWSFDGQEHRGALLIASDRLGERVTGAWIDSFHQSGHVMHLEGSLEEGGTVVLAGHYPAPSGPDWGWRIRLESASPDELLVLMDNVDPAGSAEPAVRIDVRR